MKKFLSLVVAALFVSSSAFAAKDFTASADFSNIAGSVTFDAVLKAVSNDATASAIGWSVDTSYVGNTGDNNWKAANVYAEMTKTITKAGGAVYLFQDNKASASGAAADYVAAEPRFNEGDVKVYSGLVKAGSGGGAGGDGYVVMSFKPSTTKLTSSQLTSFNLQPEKEGVVEPTQDNPKGKDYVAKFFSDQSDDGFSSATSLTYRTIADENGYVGLENTKNVEKAYMYFGGNFVNVMGGTKYGSNHIIFKTSVE